MATKPVPAEQKKPRQTKRQKAEAALAVVERKITNVDKRLERAKADVLELTAEREELLRERDYAASNPALESEVVADPSAPGGPGTTVTP